MIIDSRKNTPTFNEFFKIYFEYACESGNEGMCTNWMNKKLFERANHNLAAKMY